MTVVVQVAVILQLAAFNKLRFLLSNVQHLVICPELVADIELSLAYPIDDT